MGKSIADHRKAIFFQKEGPFPEFSNFYISRFLASGRFGWRFYLTAEHYFQAEKAKSRKEYEFVLSAPTPYEARKRGRSVTLISNWEKKKETVMRTALLAKFTSCLECRRKLTSTEGKRLVEYAPWDEYWGSGRKGKGKNRLGELLMELRDLFHQDLIEVMKEVWESQQAMNLAELKKKKEKTKAQEITAASSRPSKGKSIVATR